MQKSCTFQVSDCTLHKWIASTIKVAQKQLHVSNRMCYLISILKKFYAIREDVSVSTWMLYG